MRSRRQQSTSRRFTSAAPRPGEDAIALVEVDQKLTPALLDTVRGLPNVIQAKAMRF